MRVFFTNMMVQVCSEQHTGPQVRSRTKCSCVYMNYTQRDKRTEEQQRLFYYSTNESLAHWKLIITWHSLSTILRTRHEELSERQNVPVYGINVKGKIVMIKH